MRTSRDPSSSARGRAAALALAVAACLAGAGCGGDPADAGSGSAPDARTRLSATDGAGLFAEADCGSCHRLRAAKAGGTFGPNLDAVKPSAQHVAQQVRAGGDGMPSFAGRMSEGQINEVARYVAELAGRER